MASDKQTSASPAASPQPSAKNAADTAKSVEATSPEASALSTTLNAAMLPAGLFKRSSSSSLKRRMSNSSNHGGVSGHIATRSPILHPQSDGRDFSPGPQRFTTTSDDQSKLINALEAEEEAMVLALSRKLENVSIAKWQRCTWADDVMMRLAAQSRENRPREHSKHGARRSSQSLTTATCAITRPTARGWAISRVSAIITL